jgi:hypothetical protein
MRSLVQLFLILTLLGLPSSGEEPRPHLGNHPNITAIPVVLDRGNPMHRTVGALTYLGGVQLRSRDLAFGGFSSMFVEGDRFTLLSDGGNIVKFRMGADFKPVNLWFGDLPAGPGKGWGKGSRDSESMTRDPATGKIWVGFESWNQIWRYSPGLAAGEKFSAPKPMAEWNVNGGAESMVRRSNGDFIVIAETSERDGFPGRTAIYFRGDPTDPKTKYFQFGFQPPDGGYDPSDMVELPDGRLLVLVRRITLTRWFESKLILVDPKLIRPDKAIRGKEIAMLTAPLSRDNFEALAITQENERTMLWIASDDNRELVQKSLLMKFRLDVTPPVRRVR